VRRRTGGGAGRRVPLLLIIPAAVVAAAASLPLAYLLVRVRSADRDAWDVFAFDAAGRLVLDTAVLVAAVVAAALLLGVPLAWILTRTDVPARSLLAVAAALPLVIPSYVAALALLGALGPRGLLQQALEGPFGVERIPEVYGLSGAVLALTLSTYPYVYLLAAAAMRDLDPSVEEAARSLGQSRLVTFFKVTLPAIRPSLAGGALLVGLYVLSDFGAVSLMQYPALTRSIYLQYQALFDRDPAAILGLVLVALALLLLIVEGRVRASARYGRTGPGARRPPPVIALGRWRWPAFAFCAGVVGLFLVLPVAVLAYWVWEAVPLGREVAFPWREAGRSIFASALAALVAVVAALPVAVLARRYSSRFGRVLERLSFTGNALPGIVVALSLVFFGARYGGVLYQTLGLLIFAYVVRFLPQSLAATGAALESVDPHVEEAGRSLGRGPLSVVARVTVPLVRSGILVGATLVFLSSMKELPATLLLRPIGYDTLATEIWSATAVADYAQAAPPALLLIVLSAPFVYFLVARRDTELGAPG
jgi:iron(III) transport system permease protein